MLQGERFLEEGEGETDLRGGRLEILTFTVRSPLPLEAILFLFRPLPVAWKKPRSLRGSLSRARLENSLSHTDCALERCRGR